MFKELIQSRQEVVIHYGKHAGCVCGTIKDYHEKFEVIQLDTQDIMLPLSHVTKIELVENPFTTPLFQKHQVLNTDADFDNAFFMAIPISVWQDGQRIWGDIPLQHHSSEAFMILNRSYKKSEFTVKISG